MRALTYAALLLSTVPALAQSAPTDTASALDPSALTMGFIDKAIAEQRFKSAVELIRAAEARHAGPELDLRKAELLLASGALPEAAKAFQALEADATVGNRAVVGQALMELKAGRAEAADALLARAVEADGTMARAWSIRGVIADRRGDWKSAEEYYAKGLEAAPNSATILNNRGYSRLLQGRHAEAEQDFAAALKLEPGLETAATNMRLAKGLQGRYAEAFDSQSRDDLARDLNTVGVAAMLRGDHQLAQSYFTRAIEMNSRYDEKAAQNLAYLKHIAPELADGQKR